MRRYIELLLIAGLVIVLSQIPLQVAQADNGKSCATGKDQPIWQILKPGKDKSVCWTLHKPNKRFRIYKGGTRDNPYDDLVFDTATDLVWERAPDSLQVNWYGADDYCYKLNHFGIRGWRLPAVEELATLLDLSQPVPTLPPGHPFLGIQPNRLYWSSSTNATIDEPQEHGWGVRWDGMFGGVSSSYKTTRLNAMCVRGGRGHDVY